MDSAARVENDVDGAGASPQTRAIVASIFFSNRRMSSRLASMTFWQPLRFAMLRDEVFRHLGLLRERPAERRVILHVFPHESADPHGDGA